MDIERVVDDLLNGTGADFGENIRRLEPDRRAAISLLLSIHAGETSHRPRPGVHPIDWSDNATMAVSMLGRNDLGFLIDLLAKALNSAEMQPAFTLLWVLAHLDVPEAADLMIKATAHRSEFVRWAAVTGLRRLRLKRARPVLNKAAADRASIVRGSAVDALKSIGDESSLPVLEKRLRDRYPGIRSAAAEAIAAIGRRRKGREG